MIKTEVLPAGLRFQTELAEAVVATKGAGLECPDTVAQLQAVIDLNAELRQSVQDLEAKLAREHADHTAEAMHIRAKVIPAMDRVRAASDGLEQIVPDDTWVLPTYAEMLFVR